MTTCVKDHAVDRILHKEGKSRAWLASQTGLHHKTIHRALSNENATGDTIFAICRALDWRVFAQ
ncbi:helix-turn-helix domain-containing protein [uncultured Cohaesibacter sp.]|uniref:helix-turn-helix domain-containing protein n=1 Tax=uncultured Cohaesibacter sp. TaxID=1002546 RepID=UPI00374956F9